MNHPLVALLAVLKDNPDALMFALLLAFLGFLATLAAASVRRVGPKERSRTQRTRRGNGRAGGSRGRKK